MIISHKHKFIFIHTNKCAGTSIEVSLAPTCDTDDIIGPVTLENLPADYKHPENYDKNRFYDTMSAVEIKDNISLECWKKYFKFSVIRNPWDRMISAWHWQSRNISPDIWPDISHELLPYANPLDRFLNTESLKPISISKQLEVDGKLCTDYLIKYENLNQDYKKVCDTLKIKPTELPMAKGGFRKKSIPYWEFYNDKTKKIIDIKYKDDIENFGYKFGE